MDESTEHTDLAQENRQISRIAFWAFALNLLLALVKGWLAYTSSSLAVTAGAIDSLTDSIASLAVFAGFLLSTRKTQKFPLGLYKVENLISVIIALFIFFAGFEIAGRMINPPEKAPDITLSVLLWMVVCTAATFLFGKYALYIGKKTGSPTLISEGRHREVDVVSSLVVLASIVLNYYQIDFQFMNLTIDRIAALLVLVFIVQAGWELLSDGMRVLLDASIDYTALDKAREIIEKEPAVKQVNSLVGRNAGRFRFINAEVELRIDNFRKAHDIVHRIEENIKNEISHVERVNIYYAPIESAVRLIAFPVLKDGDAICEHFGEAPNFVIWRIDIEKKSVDRKTVIENPFSQEEKGKGIRAARYLVEQNIDMAAARKKLDLSGPGYVFSDAGVETLKVTEKTASEAVERLLFQPAPHK